MSSNVPNQVGSFQQIIYINGVPADDALAEALRQNGLFAWSPGSESRAIAPGAAPTCDDIAKLKSRIASLERAFRDAWQDGCGDPGELGGILERLARFAGLNWKPGDGRAKRALRDLLGGGDGGGGKDYRVKSGDTMWEIALRNGIRLEDLIDANPQIENPNLIFPGQHMRLPGKKGDVDPELSSLLQKMLFRGLGKLGREVSSDRDQNTIEMLRMAIAESAMGREGLSDAFSCDEKRSIRSRANRLADKLEDDGDCASARLVRTAMRYLRRAGLDD